MTFSIVDGFVRRRLRAMLRKQHKSALAKGTRVPTINAGRMYSGFTPPDPYPFSAFSDFPSG